jgi:hypothetical protein
MSNFDNTMIFGTNQVLNVDLNMYVLTGLKIQGNAILKKYKMGNFFVSHPFVQACGAYLLFSGINHRRVGCAPQSDRIPFKRSCLETAYIITSGANPEKQKIRVKTNWWAKPTLRWL